MTSTLACNTMVVKSLVKELSRGGKPDYDRVLKEGTRISVLIKETSFIDVLSVVIKMASTMNELLNVYKPMTQPQIDDLAEDFITELNWVTIEDMAVFFSGIHKQHWGHINNRIDAAVIWELWDVYCTKRHDHFHNKETAYQHANKESERSKEQESRQIKETIDKIYKPK